MIPGHLTLLKKGRNKMVIGIYDLDMILYDKFIPSLDLMKYSAYHKYKRDIVKVFYEESDWGIFDKIYTRRDKYKTDPPINISSNPKVEWVGKRFFDGARIRLPDEVERMTPDTSIYSIWYQANIQKFSRERLQLLNGILYTGTPCRITFDGELVKSFKIQDQTSLYIYDIGCFDTKEIWKVLNKNLGAKITFVERVEVPNFEDYKYLQDNFQVRRRNCQVLFTGDLNDRKVDFLNNYYYFGNQYQVKIPYISSDEEVIPLFIDLINKLFYAISKNDIFYYVYNILNNGYKYAEILKFLAIFSKQIGKTSDFCAYDVMRNKNKTLYRNLTQNKFYEPLLNQIDYYLKLNIKKINESGEWTYESE